MKHWIHLKSKQGYPLLLIFRMVWQQSWQSHPLFLSDISICGQPFSLFFFSLKITNATTGDEWGRGYYRDEELTEMQ